MGILDGSDMSDLSDFSDSEDEREPIKPRIRKREESTYQHLIFLC